MAADAAGLPLPPDPVPPPRSPGTRRRPSTAAKPPRIETELAAGAAALDATSAAGIGGAPRPAGSARGNETGDSAPDEIDRNADSAVVYPGLVTCAQGGLLLLLALLKLLAIDQILRDHPRLAAVNLPARLLADVAARFALPSRHPLLQALPELPPDDAVIEDFDCPPVWRGLIAVNGGLHRFDTRRDGSRCYVTDRSRKLLLYVGSSRLPAWTRACAITHHRGSRPAANSVDLSRSLQLLMSRYLRRHARMSLRQLIHRPARIAATRTHLDLLFEHAQMDIRIRKCGLDIDPGWVAWLARVVRFHYEDRENTDV